MFLYVDFIVFMFLIRIYTISTCVSIALSKNVEFISFMFLVLFSVLYYPSLTTNFIFVILFL